jgi:hypothetical protein
MKPAPLCRGLLTALVLAPALTLAQAGQAPATAKATADKSEECMACHGQPGMQSESGRDISVDPEKFRRNPHATLGCEACHTTIKEYPHPKQIPRVDCGSCHMDAVRDFESGVHGQARTAGVADTPTCQSCHGLPHTILPASDPASLVAKRNLPNTCGACHANPQFLARHNIPFARPVEAYRMSVHGRAVAAGNPGAASCSDCHSNHAIFPARDPRSKINHWNVPATCSTCHSDVEKTYRASICR